MNNAQQTARVGLFFLLGVALIWVTFESLSGGALFAKKGYQLDARFADIQQLKNGDDVRMAGVKVGQVEATRLADGKAEVVLRIDTGVSVPSTSTATIAMAGLIGTNYVGITPGPDQNRPLSDGAEIQTVEAPSMSKIMNELSDLGKKLGDSLGALGSSLSGDGQHEGLIQKLDKMVSDNSENLKQTMANFRQISDKINNGQGTIGKLLNDSDLHDQLLAAVKQLNATVVQARDVVAGAKEAIDQAKSGKSALGVLVYDPQTAENLRVTVSNVREVSDKIARGEGTLGKLLNDDSLFNSAKTSLQKADRALDSLNDSGPISAVGILANSLF